MRIAIVDVDSKNFPNLALMKISAHHKSKGDEVEWHNPWKEYDRIYLSKIFSFSPDYNEPLNAPEIIKGGSGYCIELKDGVEVYDAEKDWKLPYKVEHIYPDYSLYPDYTKDTAFGFMSRGCPRGCEFCIVQEKEGACSVKVADLDEFWRGQKYIEICDPNVLACAQWRDIFKQLISSYSIVNFNQGLDARFLTQEKIEMLSRIRMRGVHFAWDRYKDGEIIKKKLSEFRDFNILPKRNVQVYVLCNFDTTIEQDIERIMWIRNECGFSPYVMLYNKYSLKRGDIYKKLQRWVNNRIIFWSVPTFEEYLKGGNK